MTTGYTSLQEYWACKQYVGGAYGSIHGFESSLEQRLYRVVTCYSDSLSVIQLVSTQVNMWHTYAPIIQNIVDLLNQNWNVTLSHSLRNGNTCAVCLAKIGANSVQK